VKNHHSINNLKARLRFEITIESVPGAPIVVAPFGAYDCAPQSDGAAALVPAAVAEVHDFFTGVELISYEDLGFADRFGAYKLVEQLRGDAANQVDGARIGVAHNIGGPTAVSAITILEGPGPDGQ
jgi:acetyl-CoA acetyltransferase